MPMDIYEQICREETLYDAWKRVRKKNAKGGVDGIDPENLDSRINKDIKQLSEKLSNNSYTPTPYHQIKIPKFNDANEWRGLSLPVVMDKIVQQAFVNITSPVFEEYFLDCSYAYRPKKGPVRAIKRVEHILQTHKPRWTIAFDIDDFFDTLNHDLLLKEIAKKIDDERLISLIRIWLKAGYISQKGDYSDPDEGIAQGAVISPLLSNIYLHALDVYAVEKQYPYVRYSDNFITFFAEKDQAYVCHEEVSAFLKEDLLLKLNNNPYPFRHLKAGFIFLGIFFKGTERGISRDKEAKTFKRLNWLTNPSAYKDPALVLKRINESICAKKRFYGFINPKRQFAAFDEHLMKRLKGLLLSFGKRGFMTSKNEFADFICKVEFFEKGDEKAKSALAKKISEEIVLQLKPKAVSDLKGADKKKNTAVAYAKRSQAQKNRFLRRIADEAEVIISTPGIFIGKTSNRLILREARKNIHEHPFSKIRQITVTTSGVSLSSDVIWSCAVNKVPLAFINRQGKPYAVLQSPIHAMGELSLFQIRIYETEKAITIAKKVLTGKCRNQMNLLKFYTRHRSKTDPAFCDKVSETVEKMGKDVNEIQDQNVDGPFTEVRNCLFTAEARVSSYYWGIVKMLLPAELGFEKRDRKGAKDVVNCMLNYGYGILYQRVWQAVLMAGLNPQISFLHAFQEHKPTFVYDMIEEFRQALVDRPIFSLMTKGNRYKKLRIDPGSGLLDNFTKGLVIQAVLSRLATLIGFRGKKIRAEDVIQTQTRNLAGFIKGKKKSYRPFISTY